MQTEIDEYAQIANDDFADVISSSWGECEYDLGVSTVQAENLVFEQMALQGQSMFGAAGDSGAFDRVSSNGAAISGRRPVDTFLNVDDPASQPWVTGVGRTSPARIRHMGTARRTALFAAVGTACREVPDISANADPYTGYAEYCSGKAATPYSECTFSAAQTPPGCFAVGGTSLSSPLWAAIFADRAPRNDL